MSEKILILSDIHGNLNALKSVLATVSAEKDVKLCILLGDIIDYGMRSNEAVKLISAIPYKVICNIRGNHEEAVISEDYSRFSSERGRESAKNTRRNLNEFTWDYIRNKMIASGRYEFETAGKKCLAVHGSLRDEFWKSISPSDELSAYAGYDYVFSGHSHLPHFFGYYHKIDNPATRNKKKTIFINPGSVGQPRNLNNMAQYAVLDAATEEISLKKVPYDIEGEQKTFEGQPVDEFYKIRLKGGI